MFNTIQSPSMLAGLVRVSQQYNVVDQGPGRNLYIGTKEECIAYLATLPANVRSWCKVM